MVQEETLVQLAKLAVLVGRASRDYLAPLVRLVLGVSKESEVDEVSKDTQEPSECQEPKETWVKREREV